MLSQICYKAEKKILQIKKLALYLQCLYDIGEFLSSKLTGILFLLHRTFSVSGIRDWGMCISKRNYK